MKLTAMIVGSLLMAAADAGAAPQTLATLSGAKPQPGRLSDSVLIIVDAQREYLDGALPLANVNNALAEIGTLLARARKASTPVIHIMHRGSGSLFDPASSYFEIVAPLHPVPGETVIEKRRTSAFADTRLGDVVRATGRKRLIIVGFMTHNCVSSTARAAHDLGYKVTVVSMATATRDLPDGRGGVVPASILQTASLTELSDATAVVVQNDGDIPD